MRARTRERRRLNPRPVPEHLTLSDRLDYAWIVVKAYGLFPVIVVEEIVLRWKNRAKA